jgi:hypothetical protein
MLLALSCVRMSSCLLNTDIDEEKVWSAVCRRTADKSVGLYLDRRSLVLPFFESSKLSRCKRPGCIDHVQSNCPDFDVALTVVSEALLMGVQLWCARQEYDLENWVENFHSEAEAFEWKSSRIQIGIFSNYNSRMCALIEKVGRFIYTLKPAVPRLFPAASLEQLNIVVFTVASTPGETYAVDIIVVPEENEWARLNTHPGRDLTNLSRSYRQSVTLPVYGM